ncbi:MAG: hypothetical protein J6K96_06990 [Treponema sp.]|nr:hypothetical protein [Treponema sp.]
MNVSENEYTMEILAALAGEAIAKKTGISNIQGFDALMNSKTGEMLFDDNYTLWHNGPDYIAAEYFLEKDAE